MHRHVYSKNLLQNDSLKIYTEWFLFRAHFPFLFHTDLQNYIRKKWFSEADVHKAFKSLICKTFSMEIISYSFLYH